jgi:hypothetical protein
MIGLGEDYIWALIVELAWLGDGSDARFTLAFGLWGRWGHIVIFADNRGCGGIGMDWLDFLAGLPGLTSKAGKIGG